MSFGFLAINLSQGEVVLPAPFSVKLGINKTAAAVVDNPSSVESNATLQALQRAGVIKIVTFPVTVTVAAPPPPFILVPGPPGPPGPTGPPSDVGGDFGDYVCDSSVAPFDAVFETGGGAANKANASDISTMPAIGVVVSKSSATAAKVQYSGELDGFSGLVPAAIYWVTTSSGHISNTPPAVAGQVVQKIGTAKTTTILVVEPDKDFVIL